ncbi:MAG: hypothetical protein ABJD68_18780 [Nakamurella sp.]
MTGIVAGLLFVIAGWLSILAAQLRWGDACAGGFDSQSCLVVQDHLYDYLLPMEPWVQIAGAAELAGSSYLVVALAIALVCAAVRSSVWGRVLQVMLVLSVVLFGLTTVLSGGAGAPIEPATSLAEWLFLGWAIVGPMALVVFVTHYALGPAADSLLPPLAWTLWAGLLVLATPFPEYFLMSLAVGYTSYDTTPRTGAGAGVVFSSAGLVLIAGVVWNATRRASLSHAGRSPAASVPSG